MVPFYRKTEGKDIVYAIQSFIIHLDKGEIDKIESEDLGSACGGGETPTPVGGKYSSISEK